MNRLMLVAATIFMLMGDALLGEAAAAESGDGGAAKGKVEIVRIKPILLQLPGPGGLRRNIAITLSLELAKARYRDKVVSKSPKLKALIFESWTARSLVESDEDNFDPEEIRRRAQRTSDSLFGPDVVSRVLIVDILEVLTQ